VYKFLHKSLYHNHCVSNSFCQGGFRGIRITLGPADKITHHHVNNYHMPYCRLNTED